MDSVVFAHEHPHYSLRDAWRLCEVACVVAARNDKLAAAHLR